MLKKKITNNLIMEVDKSIWQELFNTTNLQKIKNIINNLSINELKYLDKNIFAY